MRHAGGQVAVPVRVRQYGKDADAVELVWSRFATKQTCHTVGTLDDAKACVFGVCDRMQKAVAHALKLSPLILPDSLFCRENPGASFQIYLNDESH